eukprot:TRINITY_DN116316_c0_g1_i1.p1 TRINITY_DN116316_c0_g1~~TRINITY_DN116316_c0_g1_i1.p1  ORF type:complete len:391 (+),score=193.73 TRINITY_DN116316_c0_g1_i1:33-1205(+)
MLMVRMLGRSRRGVAMSLCRLSHCSQQQRQMSTKSAEDDFIVDPFHHQQQQEREETEAAVADAPNQTRLLSFYDMASRGRVLKIARMGHPVLRRVARPLFRNLAAAEQEEEGEQNVRSLIADGWRAMSEHEFQSIYDDFRATSVVRMEDDEWLEHVTDVCEDMCATLADLGDFGGLAAPQVHIGERIAIVNIGADQGMFDPHVLINAHWEPILQPCGLLERLEQEQEHEHGDKACGITLDPLLTVVKQQASSPGAMDGSWRSLANAVAPSLSSMAQRFSSPTNDEMLELLKDEADEMEELWREFRLLNMESDWEGCFSVPGMLGNVPRFKRIRYWAQSLEGECVEVVASGFHARVVQHELDHLDGFVYPQRMDDISQLAFDAEARRHIIH